VAEHDPLKRLATRATTLKRYLESVSAELVRTKPNSLHTAVLVTGRIVNNVMANFEFDLKLEQKRDSELNPALVHVVSSDAGAVRSLRDLQMDMIARMIVLLDERVRKAKAGGL
jgi:hypothetical protein